MSSAKLILALLLVAMPASAADEKRPHIVIETNTTYVCGDRVPIIVRPIDFVPESLAWSIYPTPSLDALRVDSNGAYADFTSRVAAKYTVVVSAAGKINDKAFSTHAVKEFSLLPNDAASAKRIPLPSAPRLDRPMPSDNFDTESGSENESPPQPEKEMQPTAPTAPGVDVLIKTWANEIPNAAFRASRAEVAMLFAQKAREIQTQNVPMSHLVVDNIFKVFSVNVPPNVVTAWRPWFKKIFDLLKQMETEGALTNRAQYVTALSNVSDILLGKV